MSTQDSLKSKTTKTHEWFFCRGSSNAKVLQLFPGLRDASCHQPTPCTFCASTCRPIGLSFFDNENIEGGRKYCVDLVPGRGLDDAAHLAAAES